MKVTVPNRTVLLLLLLLLIFQIVTLQFWISISAHSGQTTIPWLMNNGREIFGTILEQHAPATSIIASLANRISPFDLATTARFLNTILMTTITIGVYQLGKRYGDSDLSGLVAALIWVLLGPVFGNVLFYFNTLLVGFVILGLWSWEQYANKKQVAYLIITGLLFGLSTLAKQQGWGVVAFFGLWLLIQRRSFRELLFYSVSALIFPILILIFITIQGNLDNYIYWNWTFNLSGYMDSVPLESNFFRKLLIANSLVPAYFLLQWRDDKSRTILLLLMYLSLLTPLYPRFGESAAVTHIPLTAIMSGIVIARLLIETKPWSQVKESSQLIASGALLSVVIGWLWMSAVMYIPNTVQTPGYDEFTPIIEILKTRTQDGDTLFVLPETDSTPQLHPLSGMLPPNTWIKGWRWYLEPPDVVDTLITEWSSSPPDFIVVFSDLIPSSQPAINPLLDFVTTDYMLLDEVSDIDFHGTARIYQHVEN
ncbi:MAG: glycosyltransferase family 39 protein [Chloroflexota bacterium]